MPNPEDSSRIRPAVRHGSSRTVHGLASENPVRPRDGRSLGPLDKSYFLPNEVAQQIAPNPEIMPNEHPGPSLLDTVGQRRFRDRERCSSSDSRRRRHEAHPSGGLKLGKKKRMTDDRRRA